MNRHITPIPGQRSSVRWQASSGHKYTKLIAKIGPIILTGSFLLGLGNAGQLACMQKPEELELERITKNEQKIFDPLHQLVLAVKQNNTIRVKDALLYINNVNINNIPITIIIGDKSYPSLLHLACKNGNLKIMKLLVEKQANIESLNKEQQTCLHIACDLGYCNIVKFLIRQGANPQQKDGSGKTPWDYANLKKHANISQFLLKIQKLSLLFSGLQDELNWL